MVYHRQCTNITENQFQCANTKENGFQCANTTEHHSQNALKPQMFITKLSWNGYTWGGGGGEGGVGVVLMYTPLTSITVTYSTAHTTPTQYAKKTVQYLGHKQKIAIEIFFIIVIPKIDLK